MDIFTIRVGFTTTRPIIVDEHFHFVILPAESLIEAERVAAQMVGTRAEMVTSTELIGVIV